MEKKAIIIDVKHPAQANLFKNLVEQYYEDGWHVTVVYLKRGKLGQIIRKEYPPVEIKELGYSRGTRLSIIWGGNILRFFLLIKLMALRRYSIAVSASSLSLALASFLKKVPILQFYDDPERKLVHKVNSLLSNNIYYPPIVTPSKSVRVFQCLKEWSYLSPKVFVATEAPLKTLNLKSKEYIFVREVSNGSFNYFGQTSNIILSQAKEFPLNTRVILSLEDKRTSHLYPPSWTVLEEPVSDIHSIIYHSKMVISSGDSMAREGAMLGVPSIYCGMREMKANSILISEGLLFHNPMLHSHWHYLLDIDIIHWSNSRLKLARTWDDMTEFMTREINNYLKFQR